MTSTVETVGGKRVSPSAGRRLTAGRRLRAWRRAGASNSRASNAGASNGGFTAVEITMVAAVIVILTLLALPLYRKRVEQSRINGALDEMSNLAKAEELAFAEAGYYFRLNDLDNTTDYTTGTAVNAGLEVPIASWNRALTTGPFSERDRLANSPTHWNGPYISYRKFAYLDEMQTTFDPNMFRDNGPILILNLGNPGGDIGDDRYPLDPWGNPYLFFAAGPGKEGQMIPDDNRFISQKRCALYSLGPDGVPGNKVGATVPQDFWRQEDNPTPVVLGTGDDLLYVF